MPFFVLKSFKCIFYNIFNILYNANYQAVMKKLQNEAKKNRKKCIIVSKKCLTLHRFNKQMIVLQILKKQRNEKDRIYVRSGYHVRSMW